MTDYKVIVTSTLSSLTEVRFYDETVDHVLAEHPEVPILLPCVQTAVEQTIIRPTHIEASYGQSVVFVDANTTNASGDPLRIPVKHVSGTSGRIQTVYFASTSGARNVIWRREDEQS